MQLKHIALLGYLLAGGCSGTTGATRTADVMGPTGEAGAAGMQGPAGPAGPTGAQGLPGKDGTNGMNGTNGTSGLPGVAGTSGTQGATGPSGADGVRGPAGPQGIQGVAGAVGAVGATGPSWTKANLYTVSSAGPIPAGVDYGTAFVASCRNNRDILLTGGCQGGAGVWVWESSPINSADSTQPAGWSCAFSNATTVTVPTAAANAVCVTVP